MPLSIVKWLHLAAEASSGFARCCGCPSSEQDLGRTGGWQRDRAGPQRVPKPASLLAIPFPSRAADISCRKQWSARAPVPELAYKGKAAWSVGTQNSPCILSRPPGTADMRRMEPTLTRCRPSGGWPPHVCPSFCQGAAGQQGGIAPPNFGSWGDGNAGGRSCCSGSGFTPPPHY